MTSTSQHSQDTGRRAGAASNARGSVRNRSDDGRQSATPAATAATGISHPTTPTVSVPALELALRSSTPPPSPCSRFPANVPMSETPTAGTK